MSLLHHQYKLNELNTFGLEAVAEIFALPENLDQLTTILNDYDYANLPFLVIGEGSNLLFQNDFKGLVLKPSIKGIELIDESKEEQVVVRVGAGESWDQWVEYATLHGWYGLENLSLIPGSVGSAPIQNIGAYGIELMDHFAWLEAWDLHEKKQVRLIGTDCRFGYRTSIFKTDALARYIITHVAFRLNKQPVLRLEYGPVRTAFDNDGGSTPMDLRNTIISIRKQKLPDPAQFGNAGSFFKNPLVDRAIFKCIRMDYPAIPSYPDAQNQVKIPAAWLIEQSEWKSRRIGNVGTWPSQPLVIVNYGGATGKEILEFSEQIRNDVNKKFGVYLEREVNVV